MSSSQHNQRVAEAIAAYCRAPAAPGYALMIDGPWGSGKTYLIKSLTARLTEENPNKPLQEPLYVSLYGVASPDAISQQLFAAAHPVLGGRAAQLTAKLLRGAASSALRFDLFGTGHDGVTATIKAPGIAPLELFKSASDRVLIFDDFERARLNAAELLGYINPLVEHDGCKVLILANELEIRPDGSDYVRWREKTIGATLRVQADAAATLPSLFAGMSQAGAKAFLEGMAVDLVSLFDASETGNLRLLQRFVVDFDRLWTALDDADLANARIMKEIAALLLVANVELRSSRMPPSSFTSGYLGYGSGIATREPSADRLAGNAALQRYPSVAFRGAPVPPEIIKEVVLDASFPLQEVRALLAERRGAARPDAPSWRALWGSWSLDQDQVGNVLEAFELDFEARAFTDEHDILHVVGVSLWLSDIGQPGWKADGVVTRIQSYIDDVFARPVVGSDVGLATSGGWSSNPTGLGFRNAEDPRFLTFRTSIRRLADDRRRQGYPQVAAQLKAQMTDDPEAFVREICFAPGHSASYAAISVLRHIPAADFAAHLAKVSASAREKIVSGLIRRYEGGSADSELHEERDWLHSVQAAIVEIADTLPPIIGEQLRNRTAALFLRCLSQLPSQAPQPSDG